MLSFTVRDLEAMVYVTVEVHKLSCTFCDHREVAEKQDLSHERLNWFSSSMRAHLTHVETQSKSNEPTEIQFLCF